MFSEADASLDLDLSVTLWIIQLHKFRFTLKLRPD